MASGGKIGNYTISCLVSREGESGSEREISERERELFQGAVRRVRLRSWSGGFGGVSVSVCVVTRGCVRMNLHTRVLKTVKKGNSSRCR